MLRSFVTVLIGMTMTYCRAEESAYQLPPPEVVDILTAPPEPLVSISPDGAWLLLVDRDALPDLETLTRRRLQLAGIRIDPAADGPFRVDYGRSLTLRRRDAATGVKLALPPKAQIGQVSWSHRSQAFVFTLVTDGGTELWGVVVEEAAKDPTAMRRLTDRLSSVLGGFDWLPDGERLLCRLVPEDRGDEPAAPRTPVGPNIQESSGNVSPARTYQDLLANPYDEAMFEHYATSQPAVVDLSGSVRTFGKPALYAAAKPSPDGRFVLTTVVKRPFSYGLPYYAFPKEIAVVDLEGRPVYRVADVPMEENIPIEGVRTGPRSVDWTSSDPATLVWFDALDGGDPNRKAEHRDRLVTLAAPFDEPPQELVRVEHRAVQVSYFANPALLAATEYDRDRRWMRTLLHDRTAPTATPRVLVDRSIRDRYGDPGDIVEERNAQGHAVAKQHGPWIYRVGEGATPEGNLPFLDRCNLDTDETERLWRCESGYYEVPVRIVSAAADVKPTIITRRESPESPPNYLLRDLARDATTALTDFADPTPQVRGVRKELVKYQRADGVPLSATLYLPADYEPGTRLPLFVWAYPVEFSDAGTAGQVTSSPSQFTRMRGASHLALVTQGYAVMDAATMPVVGDPETMNDTFVEQIVSAAQAAIDKAVELGVADRHRVGVGGHSYGGFMTANLLAHSDLFRAGVARSGAYNRTLTPFGFQAERRPLWQAKSIYANLSPFMHADKIREPLLLIHGENDDNAGTFPLQSQRMFQAVKGNGGTVRLVMLPHESHGYAARESVLHVQAETIEWLNRHVRDAPPRE